METINIQFQVPSTGQYTLDEFVAKLKDYAEKLASSISKSGNSYQETYMSQAEQEAYVAESLNRALDEMEAHKKNGTKPMDARELLRTSKRMSLIFCLINGKWIICRKGIWKKKYGSNCFFNQSTI